MTYSDIYQIVGEAYIAGQQAGMEKSANTLPINVATMGDPLSATIDRTIPGWTDQNIDLTNLLQPVRTSQVSLANGMQTPVPTAAPAFNHEPFMDFSRPSLGTEVGPNLLPPVVGNTAATDQAIRMPFPPSAQGPAPSLLAQLLQPGWGTAIRGAGGAGLGYLIGDQLGNHGVLGATLGGVAGLTPEIIKYAPKAFEKLKGLFGGK